MKGEGERPRKVTAGGGHHLDAGRRVPPGDSCHFGDRDGGRGYHLKSWDSGRDAAASRDTSQKRKEKIREEAQRLPPSTHSSPARFCTSTTWPRSPRSVLVALRPSLAKQS